jgi:hypothetical protein
MARAYTWAYVGLRLAGRLAQPAPFFDNEAVRFERRLEVCAMCRPASWRSGNNCSPLLSVPVYCIVCTRTTRPDESLPALQPFFHLDNPAPLDYVVYREQTHAHDKAPV